MIKKIFALSTSLIFCVTLIYLPVQAQTMTEYWGISDIIKRNSASLGFNTDYMNKGGWATYASSCIEGVKRWNGNKGINYYWDSFSTSTLDLYTPAPENWTYDKGVIGATSLTGQYTVGYQLITYASIALDPCIKAEGSTPEAFPGACCHEAGHSLGLAENPTSSASVMTQVMQASNWAQYPTTYDKNDIAKLY